MIAVPPERLDVYIGLRKLDSTGEEIEDNLEEFIPTEQEPEEEIPDEDDIDRNSERPIGDTK